MAPKRCYRHLDRPFVVFLGLGPMDLMLILGVGTVLILFANVILALIATLAVAVSIKRLKEGKPRGYLFYLAYRSGLLRLVPDPMRPPYLVRPPEMGKSRILRFSGVPSDDAERDEVRFYRGPRKFTLDAVTGDGRTR